MWQPDVSMARQALVVMAGPRYWLLPLLTLAWPIIRRIVVFFDEEAALAPESVQGEILSLPMTVLAVFLGMRIIAGEIEDRSLEIAYTVPGGVEKLWFAKLAAAMALIVGAEVLLASASLVLFWTFPAGALYGALQGATFYLVVSMSMGALFRNEAAGAMGTALVLGLNLLITDFGDNQLRISPFFNPGAIAASEKNLIGAAELFAQTLQNRVGMLLFMTAIVSLAFMRANRREKMLQSG